MSSHIVLTKLYVPLTQDVVVQRPELLDLLTKGLDKNLLIVTAPAGYGKTTMVAEWTKSISLPYGWLSLGKEDDSPFTFFNYFFHALDRIDPNLIVNTLNMFKTAASDQLEDIIYRCINEITAYGKEFCLIIDNFEVIQSKLIHINLLHVLKYPPPNMKLVLITRGMTGSIYEASTFNHCEMVQKEHLQFKGIDFSSFFGQIMPNALTQEDLTILEKRTDGWMVGMKGFCEIYKQTGSLSESINLFSGTTPFVFEYVLENMISPLEDDLKSFLLKISILNTMNSSLCYAVTKSEQVKNYLIILHKKYQLIELKADNDYQFSPLLREALMQLLRTKKNGEVSYLYQRASQWFYENGYMEQSFQYAIEGEDFLHASQCLYHHGPRLMKERNFSKITGWLSRFPSYWMNTQPHLLILNGWVLALQEESENAHSFIERAEKQIPYINNATIQEEIYLDIEVIKGYIGIVEKNKEEALFHMQKAADRLPRYSRYFEIGIEFIAGEGLILRSNMGVGGELKKTFELYEGLRQIWKNSGLSVVGYGSAILADIHYEWNEMDNVSYFIKRGIYLGKTSQNLGILIPIYFTYARLQKLVYGKKKMWETLDELNKYLDEVDSDPLWSRTVEAFRVRQYIEEKNFDEVAEWLDRNKSSNKEEEWARCGSSIKITKVRALAALQNHREALIYLEEILKEAMVEKRVGNIIELLLIKSGICYERSDMQQAQTTLKLALQYGEPHDYIRIFLDEGIVIYKQLIVLMQQRDMSPALHSYIGKLLKHFEQERGKLTTRPNAPTIREPLTKREKEVLNLLELGYTNKEIANKLYITIGTVKLYNHKIYSKLQVNNRTQALIRAKELEIL